MNGYNQYNVYLESDNGSVCVQVYANSEDNAIVQALKTENAPRSSVYEVEIQQ